MSTEEAKRNIHAATQALWRVAESDDTHQVESILASGADINASNAQGMTALMRAASHGRIRMVRVLLKHGADPNRSRNDKFTPLLLASFFGHEEIVRILVEHGADTDATSRFGTSAQMWAAARTFEDVVDYLENPRTSRRFSKVAAVNDTRLDAGKLRESNPVNGDGSPNFRTPAIALESSLVKEDRLPELESSTLASAIDTTNELPDVEEALLDFGPKPGFVSRLQLLDRRIVVYALTTLLLVVAVFAGLTLRRKQWLKELPSQNHPFVGVEAGAMAVGTSAADSLPDAVEAKRIAPSDTQIDKLALGNDVNNHYETQNKSKAPLITRGVVSKGESGRTNLSKKRNEVSNIKNEPLPIAESSEDLQSRELPAAPASTAKPKPAVSLQPTQIRGPAPLTTQLIAPSKSSAPKGRVIQWP